MVVGLASADGTVTRALGPVPKLSRTPAVAEAAPPRLGQHTDEVLRELLDYDDARVAALRAAGAIA
jgi:crotonobetainyl-CoA:carnitine CoA-transferase CaiB-like acyl-CoA transferase